MNGPSILSGITNDSRIPRYDLVNMSRTHYSIYYIGGIHTFPILVIANSSEKDQIVSVRFVQNVAETIPDSIEGLRVSFKIPNQIRMRVLQGNPCNRSHHFRYRGHPASSVGRAQEYYATRIVEDLSKMRVGALYLIRIVECL